MASLWRMRSKRISRPDMMGFSAVFIVIAMTVLIIFMTLPWEIGHRVSIDLPRVNVSIPMRDANRLDAISVTVMRDGRILFGSDRVTPDLLPEKIRESLKEGAEKKVYIKADARVRYGAVVEVLIGVRDAGIQNVVFLVEQRKPTQ